MTTIRASSLSDLFDCPARWEAKHINKMRLPSSSASAIGKAVHAGAAAYDLHAMAGIVITPDDAAGVVVDEIWNPSEDVSWDEETTQKQAEKISLSLHTLYCTQVSPRMDYAAIEATAEGVYISDIDITLTGTPDRVYKTDHERFGIADIKTGKTVVSKDGAVSTKGHAAQLAVYELLAEASTKMPMREPAKIIGLQVAKTPAGQRAAIGEIEHARELLTGSDDQPGLLHHAAAMLKSGIFYGNPRSMLCSDKYCPAFTMCRWRK